jgi:hypothetical protein
MSRSDPAGLLAAIAAGASLPPPISGIAIERRTPPPRHQIAQRLNDAYWGGPRAPREELMDTPTSAAPDEKTPPPEFALATQLSKEKSSPSGPPEIAAAVARLTTNSIDELHKLVSELQKMQEFLKSEVDNVQRQIDSAVAGINIIVETIGPWKSIAGSSGTRNVRVGGPAANIEQRIRGG